MHFVKLTSIHNASPILLNLARAATIDDRGRSRRITFAETWERTEHYIDVLEDMETLAALAGALERAG